MLRAALALAVLLALAFLFSTDRRRIPWRVVLAGVGLEIAFALILLRLAPARAVVMVANDAAHAVQHATDAGTGFVFGYLGGGALPFAETAPGASFILAFKALPMILTISALAGLLFYWGVLQRITGAFAWLLRRTLGISGPLALGAAVHVFVGMIEAPLLIRPYLQRMQRGELFALMTCGLAGVAGTVMVIYAGFLAPIVPDALGHIITASVIATPAALAVAAIMVPWRSDGEDHSVLVMHSVPANSIDAIVKGTMDGIPPLVGIVSLLVVTVALVSLANMLLGLLPAWDGAPITLQGLFALPFRPVMWLIGIPWEETEAAARLMATKTVLNEFVAYRDMATTPLSPASRVILTYALCGFANFGSLGILLGGLGAMVPERRGEVVALGLRAVLGGTIATCASGAVAGALLA